MPAPIITLTDIQKQFGAHVALKDINLTIHSGEFFSLLGPSGCGKTTLLRILAGIEQPTSGSLLIDGQPMEGVPANRRPTNMVFQSYAIFPHLNVEENIGYGLRNMAVSKSDATARVAEALELVKLGGLGTRNAHQLSGGQRQRVALARALVCRPKVLLLDEPLSALDKNLRQDMQMELRALQRTVGITFVFVTHDQEEALTMSDRIAVMYQGRLEQVGTPLDIYNHPSSDFVASFVGTLNRISAIATDPATGMVTLAGTAITLPKPLHTTAGQKVSVALRPETIRLGRSADCDVVLQGTVTEVHFMGSVLRARIDLAGETLSFDMFNRPGTPIPQAGAKVEISVPSADIIVLE